MKGFPSKKAGLPWQQEKIMLDPEPIPVMSTIFASGSSHLPVDGNTKPRSNQGHHSGSFPVKLHRLLNTAHEEGLEWIVSWLPNGNGFKVHKPQEFVESVLPRFFTKQTKYKSFQRQLVSSDSESEH